MFHNFSYLCVSLQHPVSGLQRVDDPLPPLRQLHVLRLLAPFLPQGEVTTGKTDNVPVDEPRDGTKAATKN